MNRRIVSRIGPQARAAWIRLLAMVRRQDQDDDFAAELESHLAMHIEDGVRAGLSEEQARRQALLLLGGLEQTRQSYRERQAIPWLENLAHDSLYGLRTLRRSPGFAITAVLTLALGIGACSAIFSLVNAVLLRSLPYTHPERLVYLFTPNAHLQVPPDVMTPSYADFFDLQRQSHAYADMTAFEQSILVSAAQGGLQPLGAARVDENFFTTLGAAPEFGRAIGRDDNQPGHDKVAVISHSLWQSMFGRSSTVLQQSLVLNGIRYNILGVMPPEFGYPSSFDLPYGNPGIKTTQIWVPLALTPSQKAMRTPGSDEVVARLRPGVSMAQAQAEMSGMMASLDKLHAENLDSGDLKGWGAYVKNFMDNAIGPVRRLMWLLLGAVVLVLLIACGNAANLLLARAASRTRELGVRVALGAGRSRIIRQLLTESLLIGVTAGLVGVGLAALFLHLLPHLDPGNIPRLNQASLDLRVLSFTVVVSLLTSLLTGILPAVAVSRMSLTGFLASGGRSVIGANSKSQSALVVAEAALVVVLLAGAGLLLRSYRNVVRVPTGFSSATITMNVALDARYQQPQAGRDLVFKQIMDKISALPGVSAAGAVSNLPLSHSESLTFLWVDGFANRPDQMSEARTITPKYFSAMNIPLIAGRGFTDEDANARTDQPTIVNQQFARIFFAGRNPIGGRISWDKDHKDWSRVVGVVADVRHTSLEETPQPQAYSASYDFGSAYVAVRSTLPAPTVAAEIERAFRSTNYGLTLADVQTMGDLVSEASAQRRFQTYLLSVFAGIALVLALVGLYGLMAYSVGLRTREMGIRMALGAQRPEVMLLVLKKAAALLGIGLFCGLLIAWAATQMIQSFLFGVGEHDPFTIVTVCGLLAVCGLTAALIPARRAASIDPMESLRME